MPLPGVLQVHQKNRKSLRENNLRILVAEDDAVLLQLYQSYLGPHEVIYCRDSSEAERALTESESGFDLVITDLLMPSEVQTRVDLEWLQSHHGPVIVVTGDSSRVAQERADPRAQVHIIEKPIEWNSFMALVSTIAQQL